MRKLLELFRIRRDERLMASVALVVLTVLNGMTIARYFTAFTQLTDNYHKLFVHKFCISGFDPLTYEVVSDWDTAYNVYRHPLLAFFMYVPAKLNTLLMWLTGMNWVQLIVAAMLVFSAFYSFLFLYRICHEVIGTSKTDAGVLAAFFFSFAYILLAAMLPDHFILSTFMLLFTLYICGMKQQRKAVITISQTLLLFVLTAGISLNNGLKTFLAALFTNGRQFFRWQYLLAAVIIPCALIWVFARVEYRHFVWPKEMARHEVKMHRDSVLRKQIYQHYVDTVKTKDSTAIAAGVKQIIKQRAQAKYRRDHQKIWNKNTGKPIADGEFMRWTDKTTSRWATAVENLFGESIQLHQDYLLGDVLRNRPVIVHYRWLLSYAVEAVIVLLFFLGILFGFRSRFLWTALSFFLIDMALHMGLGFGINEVYIMSPHWLYVIPIAIASLFRKQYGGFRVLGLRLQPLLRWLLIVITLYLFIYNSLLIGQYMAA